MNRVRPLALWLAAAIVAIVVSLTPVVSQAHEGHGAGAPGAVASLAELGAPGDARAALRQAGLARAADRSVVEMRLPGKMRSADTGCADPCCLGGVHSSSCCCAIGLVPPHEQAALRPVHAGQPLPASARGRPDIPLDALPEPPRHFA